MQRISSELTFDLGVVRIHLEAEAERDVLKNILKKTTPCARSSIQQALQPACRDGHPGQMKYVASHSVDLEGGITLSITVEFFLEARIPIMMAAGAAYPVLAAAACEAAGHLDELEAFPTNTIVQIVLSGAGHEVPEIAGDSVEARLLHEYMFGGGSGHYFTNN